MKKYSIKSLFGAGIVCLALTSCGDFLTIEPKTFVSEDNFWNEKTDIDQMVIGTYTKMQSAEYIRRCIVWGEVRGGNVGEGRECDTKQTDVYRTLREYLLSSNQFTDWASFYSVINQCNIIITRAPEVSEKDPTYTQSDVLATQAEMSFLRALSYFYLVRAFEDVPYYTTPIQSDNDAVAIGATKGDVIIRALIADLESVAGNALKAYPEETNTSLEAYYNSNCNRVTQNAIYALLADLCLWDGQFQKCIDYSQRVINAKRQEYQENYGKYAGLSVSGMPHCFKWDSDTDADPVTGVSGYPMYPCFAGTSADSYYGSDYNSIFGTGSSFESIFELAFSSTKVDDSNYLSNTACSLLYGNHLEKDGNAGEGFLAVYESVASDLTESRTIFRNQYDCRYYSNLHLSGDASSSSSTYISKYVDNIKRIEKATSSTASLPFTVINGFLTYPNRNWIFYRLTDVMLMKAEALIESASSDSDVKLQQAFALIYAVNRRSIMVGSTNNKQASSYDLKIKDYGSKKLMRELCMKERRRELMFEGKRWFDLIRYWHRDGNDEFVKSVPARSGGTVPVSYEALFWPYNKNELKNNSLLKQKTYYGEDDTDGNFSSTK